MSPGIVLLVLSVVCLDVVLCFAWPLEKIRNKYAAHSRLIIVCVRVTHGLQVLLLAQPAPS
jgi:hypothetical protein